MRFAEEVVPASERSVTAKISPSELSMAKQLVENMRGKFSPGKFKDTYRADLKRRVQEKIRKKEIHSLDIEEPSSERPKAQVIDLMDALKASLKKPSRRGALKAGTKTRKRA